VSPGAVEEYFTALQARIVSALEAIDGKLFSTDRWSRTEGGGGITRVIEDGNVFAVLVDAVKCCSLGQISTALYEVGGQYRRSM
jgi:coproporphyrinogen III oxidase